MDKSLGEELYASSYAQVRDSCWKELSDDVVNETRASLWNPATSAIWDGMIIYILEELNERQS